MMQSTRKLKSINILFSSVLTLLAAVSCSNEAEPQIPDPDEGRETSVVDISLSLGESWDIDDDGTRAAPPSSSTVDNSESYKDIKDIDKVRVITFRRKEGDKGDFFYDMKNDIILDVIKKAQGYHEHSIAKGKITKTYGYEYRVIALAYSSTQKSSFSDAFPSAPDGEGNWFTTVGETYSDFCMKLNTVDCSKWSDYLKLLNTDATKTHIQHINEEILQTPHIFYGVLKSKNSDSEIIPYAEELNKDVTEDGDGDEKKTIKKGDVYSKVQLKGILKRGVATIDFYITPKNQTVSYKVKWITVLAQTPNTKVGLSKYDDFLKPSGPYDDSDKYTAIAYIKVTNEECEQQVRIRMLPCKTRLAIRVKTTDGIGAIVRNGQLTSNSNVEVDGNNGTGIVSPDFIDGVFYFRRNHKYTITVSNSETVLDQHPLY